MHEKQQQTARTLESTRESQTRQQEVLESIQPQLMQIYREPKNDQERDRGIRTSGAGRCDERSDGFDPVGCREQDQKIRIEVGKTDQGGSAEKIQELANLSDRVATTARDAPERASTYTAKTHILDLASCVNPPGCSQIEDD